jgi:hypothetical protein
VHADTLSSSRHGQPSDTCEQDEHMEMTGWLTGQVFLQTVDDQEVAQVSEFLNARGIAFQVLTLSERMVLDPSKPAEGVTTDRFSIAIQLGGFPQVVGPVLHDLIQRAHGGGWTADPAQAGEPG